jgi:hypothetical protein
VIGRLEKNVIIARSGVYKYEPAALAGLNPSGEPPNGYDSREYFNVYRPAVVLMKAAEKFTKLPLIKEHQAMIDGKNFRDYALGWTGDSAEIVPMPGSDEVGISSTVNLIDDDAIHFYDEGNRDVSPGYNATFKWADGVSPDGEKYDIIMDSVIDVNHLAFTICGRGGAGVGMDSDVPITVETGEKVEDEKVDFETAVRDIIANRSGYDDAAILEGVEYLRSLITDIPDSDDKKILARLIDDFLVVKNAFPDDDAANVAADLVVDRYKALDAKEDTMGLFGGKAKDAVPEEVKEEAPAPAEPTPEAPKADAAPPAPANEAPVAPVAAAAMEVAQMPDDVSSLDDAGLRACLNGVVKALKALMPGEVNEPQHQGAAPEAPVADAEEPVEEKKEGAVGDSIYSMPLVNRSVKSMKASELMDKLYRSDK